MSIEKHEAVRRALLDNARKASIEHQEEIEDWHPVKADGKDFVPAYIPRIGAQYFSPRTEGHRILAYALSQNLRETDDSAREWAQDWKAGDGLLALDRQNLCDNKAMMHPFDTGHIPILASLLRSLVTGRTPHSDESIFPEVAATNLSKFSFRSSDSRLTVDSESSLRRCWDWFSRCEVEWLCPDYILCCDSRVDRIVREQVLRIHPDGRPNPKVLRVAFPSLRVINRHYRKTGLAGRLQPSELEEMVSVADRDRAVRHGLTIGGVLRRDAPYFAEMFEWMKVTRRDWLT